MAIEEGGRGEEALLGPLNWDAFYEGKKWEDCLPDHGYEVRQCNHPRLVFFERPDRDAAALIDGSEYFARLATGPDFGCTLHEPLSPSDAPLES